VSYNKPPTERDIKEFLTKNGTRGEVILHRIQEHIPEINEFIRTDFGWQLIKEDVEECKVNIWNAIMAPDATTREDARIKANILIHRLESRVKTIATYMNDIANIQGEKSDGKKV
jgi:hypothetical protein